MPRNVLSPNERPICFPGVGPTNLSGRLKSFSLQPDPEPRLDPPEDKGVICEECKGQGCEWCDFTGWIELDPDFYKEDRTDE